MSIQKTATLIGATGLVGSHLLRILLESEVYNVVRILVRKPYRGLSHPKLEIKMIQFDNLEMYKEAIQNSDIVFSCIGTTMKNVKGDKKLYKSIDYDITVHAAAFAKQTGCEHFIFISSVGANSKSNNFYLNLKGKIEDDVIATGIKNIGIVQPGFIDGNRKEKRSFENILKLLLPVLKYITPSKYHIVQAESIAKSMFQLSCSDLDGIVYLQNKEIETLAKISSNQSC